MFDDCMMIGLVCHGHGNVGRGLLNKYVCYAVPWIMLNVDYVKCGLWSLDLSRMYRLNGTRVLCTFSLYSIQFVLFTFCVTSLSFVSCSVISVSSVCFVNVL